VYAIGCLVARVARVALVVAPSDFTFVATIIGSVVDRSVVDRSVVDRSVVDRVEKLSHQCASLKMKAAGKCGRVVVHELLKFG
jgi:hypothetical protein